MDTTNFEGLLLSRFPASVAILSSDKVATVQEIKVLYLEALPGYVILSSDLEIRIRGPLLTVHLVKDSDSEPFFHEITLPFGTAVTVRRLKGLTPDSLEK